MKRAALIVGLAYLWTFIASLWFCFFDFRLFTIPFVQWWGGLYYFRNMLWLPKLKLHDISHWPILWFVAGFVVATLVIIALCRPLLGSIWPSKDRQPNLYGESEFASVKAMADGGITSEKRR